MSSLVSSAGNLISGLSKGARDIYRVDLDILLRDSFGRGSLVNRV